MAGWTSQLKEDARKLSNHTDKIQFKLNKALDTLETISRGYHFSELGHLSDKVQKLKATAAITLKELAKDENAKPYSSYF